MPTVVATFESIGDHLHRTAAYMQWGTSDGSIGCCLLLNPGSAKFGRASDDLQRQLELTGKATGPIDTDPTMVQLAAFIESIYEEPHLDGRFHIYNLFTLQSPQSIHAIAHFESLVSSGQLELLQSLVPMDELRSHPWILLGWGCEQRPAWKHLPKVKEGWLNAIRQAGVPSFGIPHPKGKGYYHPCPLIPTKRPAMLADLVTAFKHFHQDMASPSPFQSLTIRNGYEGI